MARNKHTAFTLVELLMVMGIIALLVGILIPAVNMVRTTARITKQKGQFGTMDMAILAYKNDFGDYPPSDYYGTSTNDYYCGAQKIAEALVGWDLLGFHPNSAWRPDGKDASGIQVYITNNTPAGIQNLKERKGPYLDVASASAFKIYDLGTGGNEIFRGGTGNLATNTYVFCDAFPRKRITIGDVVHNAGTPILYYRANTTKFEMVNGNPSFWNRSRYNFSDNTDIAGMVNNQDPTDYTVGFANVFYTEKYKIIDQQIYKSTLATGARYWPYRPDSYILISAGPDGKFGTLDDITNF